MKVTSSLHTTLQSFRAGDSLSIGEKCLRSLYSRCTGYIEKFIQLHIFSYVIFVIVNGLMYIRVSFSRIFLTNTSKVAQSYRVPFWPVIQLKHSCGELFFSIAYSAQSDICWQEWLNQTFDFIGMILFSFLISMKLPITLKLLLSRVMNRRECPDSFFDDKIYFILPLLTPRLLRFHLYK